MEGIALGSGSEKTSKLGFKMAQILRQLFSKLAATNTDHALIADDSFDFSSYSGNDVDLLVNDTAPVELILRELDFAIKKEPLYGIKAFAVVDGQFIVVDVISASLKGPLREVGALCLADPALRLRTSVNTLSRTGILLFKAVSVSHGLLHSEYQITRLRSWYDRLDATQQGAYDARARDIMRSQLDAQLLSYLKGTAELSILLPAVNNARKRRYKNRFVFKGRVLPGLLAQPKLLLGVLRSLVSGKAGSYSLPNIAIVGNDGSGKTTMCEFVVRELYKLDPIHINMRGDASYLSVWNDIRPRLVAIVRSLRAAPALSPLAWVAAWTFEVIEFLDRRLRIAFGKALSDSGIGVVIFERYPTDRLRGELRLRKASLYPLDQFMPMPDLLYLIDVSEEQSLKRKSADGHTLVEMTQKRANYKRLIQFVDRSVVVEPNSSLSENQAHLTHTIYRESLEKQLKKAKPNRFRKKEFLRNVSVAETERVRAKQKHGFF